MIKDRVTHQVLMKGIKRGNLYTVRASPVDRTSSVALFSTKFQAASDETWHQHLGHPQAAVVAHLRQSDLTKVTANKATSLCDSCQLGKISKLPFLSSSSKTTVAFEKIHIDLWGPAPVTSVNFFIYYAAIVDDFTRFIWFLLFEKYVSWQFGGSITIIQTDGGGESVNYLFQTHLQTFGIIYQLSCPYTPEQNGIVERRHRVIYK